MTDDDSPPQRHPARQAVLWIVKIAVSAGLLYVLLRRMDLDSLWSMVRTASFPWLVAALGLYFVMLLISAWRWGLLLHAQRVPATFGTLIRSYLVATFFNNFLPSNIGGDVIRIGDTARLAGSKTLATVIVLVDRGIGLLGLVFVAALGATVAAATSPTGGPVGPGLLWGALLVATAAFAWAVAVPHGPGTVLRPLRALNQEWVSERLERLTDSLSKFRDAPRALVTCFATSILVQAVLVAFYEFIAYGLHMDLPVAQLAIVVPISFVVLMLPISVNGLGLREATFGFYLSRMGLPLTAAVTLSLVSAAIIMLFSTSGAVAYITRRAGPARNQPAAS